MMIIMILREKRFTIEPKEKQKLKYTCMGSAAAILKAKIYMEYVRIGFPS
jgi:hypothetical protein